jgi:hypothetical protein
LVLPAESQQSERLERYELAAVVRRRGVPSARRQQPVVEHIHRACSSADTGGVPSRQTI